MKIYSWNVNGIRAVQKKGFIEWVMKEQPDILCLQETKAEVEQLDDELLNIPGYYSCFNSAERKGYSGVAIYSRTEPLKTDNGFGVERFDNEGRVIVSEYPGFTLLNIYFPNGQKDDVRLAYKMDFYDATLDFCESLRKQGKKLVICGDYNTAHREIDLKNPKPNAKRSGFLPIEREWIDRFIAAGYVDTFRSLYPETVKYSWWSYRFSARKNNAGWRIDYHFVSKDLFSKVRDAMILNEVQGSDHCPVVLELDL
jgi:exodeoxyribonuclease-3